jgi:hypothetical protein
MAEPGVEGRRRKRRLSLPISEGTPRFDRKVIEAKHSRERVPPRQQPTATEGENPETVKKENDPVPEGFAPSGYLAK